MDLTSLTAIDLAQLIRTRGASAREVTQAHLARIDSLARLNAVVTLDAERALARARAADAALQRGESWGELHGVPFTLKDMHATSGVRSTCGLKALAHHVPAADGPVAERLRAAGAILLGKTNMAMNVESESDLFGRPLNPYALERTAGGSSGGAAAALAARLTPLDVGTDLSGSIRMPAHFCGVFGLKPTVHRIPASGLVGPTSDMPRVDRLFGVCGPLARSIADLGVALRLLAGPHPADPEVPPVPVAMAAPIEPGQLRIALAPAIPGIPVSRELREALERLGRDLESAGARVERPPLPFAFEELLAAFRRLIRFPIAAMAAHGMAPPGAAALAANPPAATELLAALAERDHIIQRFEAWLADHDAWICPAAPSAAFPHRPLGEPILVDGESVSSQVIDHPSMLATYAGSPALVVPIGLDGDRLPIAAQLVGRRWSDEQLLAVGQAVASVVGPLPPPPEP
ncbi:MAG TPA: amidase [Kofleriaceae bacterium]|nr:amidase [Kofleriaceae bacterium]